jgi:hypothetical protein
MPRPDAAARKDADRYQLSIKGDAKGVALELDIEARECFFGRPGLHASVESKCRAMARAAKELLLAPPHHAAAAMGTTLVDCSVRRGVHTHDEDPASRGCHRHLTAGGGEGRVLGEQQLDARVTGGSDSARNGSTTEHGHTR